MKKTLIVAALVTAATMAPTMPTLAADAAPAVESKCYILPLLPDCAAEWHDAWKAKGLHVAMPHEWWTCKKAEAGSGHLLDCDTDV